MRHQQHGWRIPLAVAAAILASQGAWAQTGARAGDMRVVLAPGQVVRQTGAATSRTDAQKGMPVFYQDLLETGVGGRMRARLDDGSILAVGPQSQLRVIQHNAVSEQTELQLQYGKVRSQVVRLTKPGAKFETRTNTAVAGVIGTDFIVDAFSPTGTLVLCIEGQVEVRSADPNVPASVILNPGELTIVGQGTAPEPPRPATPDELAGALEGTTGAAPQAVADIGTGFATIGQTLLLDGADSFATGGVASWRWTLTREGDSQPAFARAMEVPSVAVDTTPMLPGNYNGTLEIVTPSNATAQTSFGIVLLPADASNINPDQLIRQLQLAYETLQPSEFMKLFNADKYPGYAALQQSVETSFRNLAQARVFVRRANGQIFESGRYAIYQVDFEIQYAMKARPEQILTVREQATLRMESGSPWLIVDVPQGALGSAGLLGIPGVGDPTEALDPDDGDPGSDGDIEVSVAGGGGVTVTPGGASNTVVVHNGSPNAATITFDLPPGLGVSGSGQSGPTFTIPPGGSLNIVFTAAPGAASGTVVVPSTVGIGGSTLPGPDIPVTVVQLTLSVVGAGSSGANPALVLLGSSGTATVAVNSSAAVGQSISLTGSGGLVGVSFNPNPVVIPPGSTSANSTVTLTAAANVAAGPAMVSVQGTVGNSTVSTTLFINRIPPFNLSLVGPATRTLIPNIGQILTLSVTFLGSFTGPVQVAPPAASGGISFSPATPQVVNASGQVNFTIAGTTPTQSPLSFNFTATGGGFSQQQQVAIEVINPIDFTLSANPTSLSLQPGQSGSVDATVAFVSGNQQPVVVASRPAGGDPTPRIAVTGGATLPNASGNVTFNVAALPAAPPGLAQFDVFATAGATTRSATVNVTVLGSFEITGLPGFINAPVLPTGAFPPNPVPLPFSITPAQGFNAPVALTYSSNNPGVAVSGPATLSPGQPGTLTITPSANASGPASVTITGVSGSVTKTVTIGVNLGAFALTTSAAQPITLPVGGSASLPVTVTPVQAFQGDVQLAAVGTNGIVADTVPPVLGGRGTATFTLTAPPSAIAGPATVTVTGTSGGATSALLVNVLLTDGFTLTSDPTTLFLGNATPLTISIQRSGFTGSIAIQPGTLPPGVVSITPPSVTVPAGSSSAQFQVTAVPQASAAGLAVSIPFTATAAAPATPLLAEPGGAALVSHNVTGVLKAPFEAGIFVPLIIDFDSITNIRSGCATAAEVGDTLSLCVSVAFTEGFDGAAVVSASTTAGGLQVATPPVTLTESDIAVVGLTGLIAGTYSPRIAVQASNFVVMLTPTVVFTPPPFTLRINPSPLVQFNGTVQTLMQIEVVPQPGFNQPVTITIPDGKDVLLDAGRCTSPPGFVSYTGSFGQPGVLTISVPPPYAPVPFCMAANVFSGVPNAGSETVLVSAFASGTKTQQYPLTLRVGIPRISVSRVSTFNIGLGQTVQASVRVDPIEGYNLPVQLWLTGPFSYCNDGTNLDALPNLLASSDCGPAGPGKIVSPGSSVTCSLTNISTGGSRTAQDVLAFALYPYSANQNCVEQSFRVCALGPGDPLGCGIGILGDEPSSLSSNRPAGSDVPAGALQGRHWLEARNGHCAGFRFATGTQTFCGGSDLELTPSLSAEGAVQVEALAMNGGILDLGPQALSGSMEIPASGYGMRASLETGRLYAVKAGDRYALFTVARMRSEIDPRLAVRRAGEGLTALGDSLDGVSGDGLADALLNRSRVSIDLQWVTVENGRSARYSFSAGPSPSVRRGVFQSGPQPGGQ